MPKSLDFTLPEKDLELVAKAINSDHRPEVRQRAMGLRLLHEGTSPKQVANLMSVSQPTVYDWHHRWQSGHVDGLANRPKSGRRPKADEKYVSLLEELLEQDPQKLGYSFTVWTTTRLRQHLEQETGIKLGQTQFRLLLKANGFVYRRPKHELKNLQDADARDAAGKRLEELKKQPKRARSTFSLWMKAV